MPTTPYKATILAGAHAYSAPFGTDWGEAEEGKIVTVGNEWQGYGRVDLPLWPKNLKPYWVLLSHLEEYVAPPPTSGVAPIRSVTELDDGSVWEATQFTRIA